MSKVDTTKSEFAANFFKFGQQRVPGYSKMHPMIPRLYVPEWKKDMKDRKIITKNATLGGVPNYEHEENLFLEKREQLVYNIEDGNRVASKIKMPPRKQLLSPPFYHEASRFQGSLMYRRDDMDM